MSSCAHAIVWTQVVEITSALECIPSLDWAYRDAEFVLHPAYEDPILHGCPIIHHFVALKISSKEDASAASAPEKRVY